MLDYRNYLQIPSFVPHDASKLTILAEALSLAEKQRNDILARYLSGASSVLDKLSAEHTDVTFLAVDIDNNPEFAQKMNVRSVPTLLYFKNGNLVHTTRGLQKEPQIKELLLSL